MAGCEINAQAVGVYRAILYFNDNIVLRRPDISKPDEVDLISFGGGTITIDFEDEPKWSRERTTGGNHKEMFLDSLNFFLVGLSDNNNLILKTLRELRQGFILELQLLNKQNILFQAPFYLEDAVSFEFNNGVHAVSISNRVRTPLSYLTKLNDLTFAFSFYIVDSNSVLAYDLANPLIINE